MAVAQRNTFGLGNAQSNRRRKHRNKLKQIDRKEWSFKRRAFFNHNVKMAAAAKAYRLVHDVTLMEVAEIYGVCYGTAGNWESGKYAWRGGTKELEDYFKAVRQAAN